MNEIVFLFVIALVLSVITLYLSVVNRKHTNTIKELEDRYDRVLKERNEYQDKWNDTRHDLVDAKLIIECARVRKTECAIAQLKGTCPMNPNETKQD